MGLRRWWRRLDWLDRAGCVVLALVLVGLVAMWALGNVGG